MKKLVLIQDGKQILIVYNNFNGISNIDDSYRIDRGALVQAQNVDIDKTGGVHRRKGYTSQLTGNYKSIWANDSIVLAVKNGNLMRIYPGTSYAETTLKIGVGEVDMVYLEVKDRIFYTNNMVIEYIKDFTAYSLATPTTTFKRAMPPGHLLELYRGVVYLAKDNLVMYSDAYAYGSDNAVLQYDVRNDPHQFANRITLMKSVADGIYISDGKTTVFMQGPAPQKMTFHKVADYGVVDGTGVAIKDIIIGGEYYKNAVIWRSSRGICVGGNEGYFRNLTELKYSIQDATKGTGFFKRGTINQYISITRS